MYHQNINTNEKRYNHWFWNNRVMICVAKGASKLNSFIWSKQYGGL